MRLVRSCYFCEPSAHGEMYRRLARVLNYTATTHCAGWDVCVEEIDDPGRGDVRERQSFVWNTAKLKWWRDRVLEAEDGDEVLLADADTAILRPLDDVWSSWNFDVAYTVRARSGYPLNGGVVFVRVNRRTRRFFDEWWYHNVRFFEDPTAHAPWRARYAGMNQASLGYVLEEVDHGCRLTRLPCVEWNLVEWDLYDPARTRILHVKSKLRRLTFGLDPDARVHQRVRPLITLWHTLERAAERKRNGRTRQP